MAVKPKKNRAGKLAIQHVLPADTCKTVGPFVFLDHMGPSTFPAGHGMDIHPHPHIGIATLTYLLDGTLVHRDSLGFAQLIKPGEVSWMTAGRGIVHSERTPQRARARGSSLHGLQCWVALPEDQEESDPSFTHHTADRLPSFEADGVKLVLIAGQAFNLSSPVAIRSPLFYAYAKLARGGRITLPTDYSERAIYLLKGGLTIAGIYYNVPQLILMNEEQPVEITADETSQIALLGGEPVGERTVWWTFSSSSQTRLERARNDWQKGRFGKIPGEPHPMPLPLQ